MLGLIYKKPKDTVPCYLEGKHPSFRDYVQVGSQSLISIALANWVREGYADWVLQAKAVSTERDQTLCSWRFWCKGSLEDQLALGIIRDSSDSIGRRYPLLIMSWKNSARVLIQSWERLPEILEGTWQEMEIVATRHFKATKELIRAIELAFKGLCAQKLMDINFSSRDREKALLPEVVGSELDTQAVVDNGVFHVALGHVRNDKEGMGLVVAYSGYLKALVGKMPSAVFVGGPVEAPQLFFFYRPLSKMDFKTLWSCNYS